MEYKFEKIVSLEPQDDYSYFRESFSESKISIRLTRSDGKFLLFDHDYLPLIRLLFRAITKCKSESITNLKFRIIQENYRFRIIFLDLQELSESNIRVNVLTLNEVIKLLNLRANYYIDDLFKLEENDKTSKFGYPPERYDTNITVKVNIDDIIKNVPPGRNVYWNYNVTL
jgi:hypothetical protein